ncbi:uncharacterized protein ACWYII_045174 [Salvelinus alpinus]
MDEGDDLSLHSFDESDCLSPGKVSGPVCQDWPLSSCDLSTPDPGCGPTGPALCCRLSLPSKCPKASDSSQPCHYRSAPNRELPIPPQPSPGSHHQPERDRQEAAPGNGWSGPTGFFSGCCPN